MSSEIQEKSVKRLLGVGRRKGYLLTGEIEELISDDLAVHEDRVRTLLGQNGIEVIGAPEVYRNRQPEETSGRSRSPSSRSASVRPSHSTSRAGADCSNAARLNGR